MLNGHNERQLAMKFAAEIAEKYETLLAKAGKESFSYADIDTLMDAAGEWMEGRALAIQPNSQRGASPSARQLYADFLAMEVRQDDASEQCELSERERARLSEKFITLVSNMTFPNQTEEESCKKKEGILRRVYKTYIALEKYEIAAAVYSFADQHQAAKKKRGEKEAAEEYFEKIRKKVDDRLNKLNEFSFALNVIDNQVSAAENCARAANTRETARKSYRIPLELIADNAKYPEAVVVMTWVYYTWMDGRKNLSIGENCWTESFPLNIGVGAMGLYLGEKNQKEAFKDKIIDAYLKKHETKHLKIDRLQFGPKSTLYQLALSKEAVDLFKCCLNEPDAETGRYIEIMEEPDTQADEVPFDVRSAIHQIKEALDPAQLTGLRKGEEVSYAACCCQIQKTLQAQYDEFSSRPARKAHAVALKRQLPLTDALLPDISENDPDPSKPIRLEIWLLKLAMVQHWIDQYVSAHPSDQTKHSWKTELTEEHIKALKKKRRVRMENLYIQTFWDKLRRTSDSLALCGQINDAGLCLEMEAYKNKDGHSMMEYSFIETLEKS